GGPHFLGSQGYVAARNAPPCQTTFRRCTRWGWGDGDIFIKGNYPDMI
ncbi:MAG: hypothetical protein F6K55_37645, partial [Moorea sp. SIO4A3]|nr:hypothetical protein [Moorena sp. SIO4A3]